jgi:hypothetical protein
MKETAEKLKTTAPQCHVYSEMSLTVAEDDTK